MPERLPEFPVPTQEIVSCLDGVVYIASAERPTCGTVVAAGFGPWEARIRAQTRARALEDLYQITAGPGGDPGSTELRLADFVAGSVHAVGSHVAGVGVASGTPYLLPVEVVWLGERDCGVAPTVVGVMDDSSDHVSSAIADVLAYHVVTGWWGHRGIPLLRVTRLLDSMIAPAAVAAACAAGLVVSAYVVPGPDVQTVLASIVVPEVVAPGQPSAAIGIAAGRLVASTVPVAFLRALAAMVQPPGAAPGAHHLAWRCRAADIAWLERHALEADLTRADELAFWEGLPDWADIARRQFGHEPVLFSAGLSGHPAKVLCPGASCYRRMG
jgi:hypothetical protein